MDREPSAEEILKAIGDPNQYKEIVFCGYGEPLIRLDIVLEVAKKIKSQLGKRKTKIRIDTNGLANLFWGRNITPELKKLIDIVSVSLNAENEEVYDRICHPVYGKKAYPAIIDFIKESKKYIPEVEVTVVDLPVIDINACKKIAKDLGASFRIRPYYEEKYVP